MNCDVCGIDLRGTGSHYHCGGCGEVTGMYGHYIQIDSKTPDWLRRGLPDGFKGHRCEIGRSLLMFLGLPPCA